MSDAQEKQFKTWEVPTWMKHGFITAMMVAISYLYWDKSRAEREMRQRQDELVDKVLEHVLPTVDKMNKAAIKMDTVAERADAAVSKVDSVTAIIKK